MITETQLSELAERYFAWRHSDDLASERFKTLPADEQSALVARAKQSAANWLRTTLERIRSRDITLYTGAALHPDNKFSRQLFTLETGIELPAGAKATSQAVAEFVGQDKLQAEEDRKAAEREAVRERGIQAERERCQRIQARIRAGEQVAGDELADCCRHLGIELHPRTLGVLRKRVVSIGADSARVYQTKSGAKSPLSPEVYAAYAKCAS